MDIGTLIHTLEAFYEVYGYFFVFLVSLVETTPMGWMIPGGLLIALGGFYSYDNVNTFAWTIISGSLGMFATLVFGYWSGSKTGIHLEKFFRQEKNAKKAKSLLQKNGAVILTTAMIANITRFWISYVAGNSHYDKKKFVIYALVSSFTWNTILVTTGYLAGTEKEYLETGLARIGILAWIIVILLGIFIFWKISKEKEDIVEENE